MSRRTYDVFLSFRGEDFADDLYYSLKRRGISTFKDDGILLEGEENYDLIEKSRFLMVIFSTKYASSPRCLRLLVKILILSAKNSKHKVLPIFYDVEPNMVRQQTGSYAKAFAKHEVSNKPEVDEWRKALSMAASIPGWDLNNMTNRHEHKFINHITEEICRMLASKRKVAIFWDIESCSLPNGVCPEDLDLVGDILALLRHQTEIKWEIVEFNAYASFLNFPEKTRVRYGRKGARLIELPNDNQDARGRQIIVDMFFYARGNPPPSYIMLFTGDFGFANALHVLCQRRYNVSLIVPSGLCVSRAMMNAANSIWEWSEVVRGEELVTTMRSQIKENSDDAVNKEQSIESGEVSMGSRPSSKYNPDDVMQVDDVIDFYFIYFIIIIIFF